MKREEEWRKGGGDRCVHAGGEHEGGAERCVGPRAPHGSGLCACETDCRPIMEEAPREVRALSGGGSVDLVPRMPRGTSTLWRWQHCILYLDGLYW